ncbi:MAG: Hpt domain-containing protein [Gammaproteobacteria bacterium]|jgi:two-component system sensor histidine kinase BarA
MNSVIPKMEPILDKNIAIEKAGGSSELAKELFAMLLKELPELKNLMNMAYQTNDPQGFWDHTHKIHGSTAYCGVPAMRVAASMLEKSIKADKSFKEMEGDLNNLNKSIDQLLTIGHSELESDWP